MDFGMGAGTGAGADVGAFDDIDEGADWASAAPKGPSIDDGLLTGTLNMHLDSQFSINEAIKETLKQVG